MPAQSWFATITRPRGRLIATITVWSWFIIALTWVALSPENATWLQLSAAGGVVAWYVVMMNSYRKARRRPAEADGERPPN